MQPGPQQNSFDHALTNLLAYKEELRVAILASNRNKELKQMKSDSVDHILPLLRAVTEESSTENITRLQERVRVELANKLVCSGTISKKMKHSLENLWDLITAHYSADYPRVSTSVGSDEGSPTAAAGGAGAGTGLGAGASLPLDTNPLHEIQTDLVQYIRQIKEEYDSTPESLRKGAMAVKYAMAALVDEALRHHRFPTQDTGSYSTAASVPTLTLIDLVTYGLGNQEVTYSKGGLRKPRMKKLLEALQFNLPSTTSGIPSGEAQNLQIERALSAFITQSQLYLHNNQLQKYRAASEIARTAVSAGQFGESVFGTSYPAPPAPAPASASALAFAPVPEPVPEPKPALTNTNSPAMFN